MIEPCISCGCGCESDDEDVYSLTYELPGVKKEEIHLHIVKEGLRLNAPRGEYIEYFSEYTFGCEVDPNQAKVIYEDGILTISVPYTCPDPFKGSKPIAIA